MITSLPRNVRVLLWFLAAQILLGTVCYTRDAVVGGFVWLRWYFSAPGPLYFGVVATAGAWFVWQALRQFQPGEKLRTAWLLIFLAAGCRFIGMFMRALPVGKLLGWEGTEGTAGLPAASLVIGGPFATAFLIAGFHATLRMNQRFGLLRNFHPLEIGIAVVALGFTAVELVEIARVFLRWRLFIPGQFLLWFSDPLLAVLLIQALLLRRSSANLGRGLVSLCWATFAMAAFITTAGDILLFLMRHGYIYRYVAPVEWFIWFFSETAFAAAPCFQLAAVATSSRRVQPVFAGVGKELVDYQSEYL